MLTEEEEEAVDTAKQLYDATAGDQELTESGTVGEVGAELPSALPRGNPRRFAREPR